MLPWPHRRRRQADRFCASRRKYEASKSGNFVRGSVGACPLTKFNGHMVHRVEIDHTISREGGADDVKNLWPRATQENGAHKNGQLEGELHKWICNPPSAALLKEYRRKIAADWIALHHEICGDEQPPQR